VDCYAAIRKQHDFEVPTAYRQMYEKGFLDSSGEHALEFSDLEWLPPETIAAYRPPPYRAADFLPFAETGRGDTWSWAMRGPFAGAIVFCPHDSSVGEVHAKEFTGHIYRLMLEELSCCWLGGRFGLLPDEVHNLLRQQAVALEPFLPSAWSAELARILAQSPRTMADGELAFIACKEADAIILRDLGLSELNESIRISA
jgi:hypothetical protein